MTCVSVPLADLRNTGPAFSLLLSPIKVGQSELRNRVVKGSIHTRLGNGPNRICRLAVFYETRARGRVGLITTSAVSPNRYGRVEEDGLDSPSSAGQARYTHYHRKYPPPSRRSRPALQHRWEASTLPGRPCGRLCRSAAYTSAGTAIAIPGHERAPARGARVALKLDAKRIIDEGMRLACAL